MIYKRTWEGVQLGNNTDTTIGAFSGFSKILFMYGMAYYGTSEYRPLPFSGGGTNDIRLDYTGGSVHVKTFADWSSYKADVTVLYTKP